MSDVEKDLELKMRLMRLFWFNGYYVRRNVDILRFEAGKKADQYTDIDVVCVKFSHNLTKTVEVCDCKSGATAKSAERIFWLSGVMKYFGASKGYFVRSKIMESKYVDLANKLEITPLSEKQLAKLESSYNISSKPFLGSFDKKCIPHESEMLSELKNELKSVYEYVNYKYWVDTPSQQINSLVHCGNLVDKSKLEKESKSFVSLYILIMCVNSVLDFSRSVLQIPVEEQEKYIKEGIVGGEKENYEKVKMLNGFYDFMTKEIELKYKSKYPVTFNEFLSNFYPPYLLDFTDFVQRICSNPVSFISTPQILSFLMYEYVLLHKELNIQLLTDIYDKINLHNILKSSIDAIIFGGKCGILCADDAKLLSNKLHEIQKNVYIESWNL